MKQFSVVWMRCFQTQEPWFVAAVLASVMGWLSLAQIAQSQPVNSPTPDPQATRSLATSDPTALSEQLTQLTQSLTDEGATAAAIASLPSAQDPTSPPSDSSKSVVSVPSAPTPRTASTHAIDLITPASSKPTTIAQDTLVADSPDEQRKRLLIQPLVELRAPGYAPGSTAGGPTAFGAEMGDAYVGLSLSSRRPRVNKADGAISAGFGLGDAQKAVALETNVNIGSLRRFASNGDFGFKLHRALPGEAAIALGWDSGIKWGSENRTTVSTVYGVASKIFRLRPESPDNSFPLTVSVGLGGGRFRTTSDIRNKRGGVNVFGSVGLQVAPQMSLVSTWTGQDLNVGVSVVPKKTTPLFLTAVAANVFRNNDNATVYTLSIGYGFNFNPQF